jgi:large-conductance mechanosensitive channel
MSFDEFIYEQGIVGVAIGTITGFAITGFIKDLNNNLIIKILKHFKMSNIGMVSSLIEFIALMLIVYLLYNIVLYPIFNKHIKADEQAKKKHIKWKEELLNEVKTTDLGSVRF